MDLHDWPTDVEAAAQLACSTKTIARYAAAGKIEMRKRPVAGRKPENVCNPRDVERLLPAVHVMPPEPPPSASLELSAAETPAPPVPNGQAAAFFALIETIATAIATVQTPPTPQPKPWISLEEAAALSGMSAGYILDRARVGYIVSAFCGPHGRRLFHRQSVLDFRPYP